MASKVKPLVALLLGMAYFGIAFFLTEPYNLILWFISGIMLGLSAAQVIIEKCMKGKND